MSTSVPPSTPGPPGVPDAASWQQRLLAVGLAAVGVLLAVLAVVAWQRSASALRVQTIESTVVSESAVSVTIAMTVDPRARVTCDVEAKAANGMTVGATTVELQPTESRTRQTTVAVPTRLRAVRGEAVRCKGVLT